MDDKNPDKMNKKVLKTGTYKLFTISKSSGYGEEETLFFEDIINILMEDGHHTLEDFEYGDIIYRISSFYSYKLGELDISILDYKKYSFFEGKVLKIMKEIKEDDLNYPPILYDPINKTIIDGVHRIRALKRLGFKKIKAYIGELDSINEEPYTYEDLYG
jgi:hypothetical protein